MRTLKFRAWHKRKKKMYRVAILYPDVRIVILQIGDTLFSCHLDDVELMEFIGQSDKHDKEIYEGDVVEYLDNTSQGLVKKRVTITDIRYLPDFGCSKWEEVIGNCHEHPDLLNEEAQVVLAMEDEEESGMEYSYVEEIAPLTEEQWERIIAYYRLKCGRHVAQGPVEAKQFQASVRELQRLAGHAQEHIGEVSQAVLDMATEEKAKK